MTTLYQSLLQVCGLSHSQAADFHDVSRATVNSWSSGRRQPPQGVLDELSGLFRRMMIAADEALDVIESHDNLDEVELSHCDTDEAARKKGWPSTSCQAAMLAMIAAQTDLAVRWVSDSQPSVTDDPAGSS